MSILLSYRNTHLQMQDITPLASEMVLRCHLPCALHS